MRKILTHKKYLLPFGLVAADLLFFGFTNPARVSSPLLIVGFLLVVVTLYVGLRFFLSIAGVYNPWFRRQKRPVAYLTGLLGVTIALQSIGQLTLRDVVVLTVLSGVMGLYYDYSKSKTA
ncbi:MAG: hypothetical protein ABI602_04965 [Candidatus Saccharibacteria bacterium]